MAINSYRNKPIGPGGSTRHLHQICRADMIDNKATDLLGVKQDRRGRKG